MARRPKDIPPPPPPDDDEDEAEGPVELSRVAQPGAEGEGWLGGQILIAMPSMGDPRFARSVICICAHSPEGAMGIVLNRAIENLTFDELLKQLDVTPLPPQRRIRLYAGGPVEGGRGFVLHTQDWSSEGSLNVAGGYALTASVDILKAIASGGGPRQGILALGYAGWGPGQLESEFQHNAWLSVEPDEALLFGEEDQDAKWRQALAKLKVDPLLLVDAAGRA
ncbi:YqgE/AlgH family protein [Muricoccus radiodurans]|uniref:YqgE/AlgH family protein n=1 Tax=Muricoccus radiodurans TaxID=2231721 RepID=UPI003CEB4A46